LIDQQDLHKRARPGYPIERSGGPGGKGYEKDFADSVPFLF